MADHKRGDNSNPPSTPAKPVRILRRIQKIKHYFQDRAAEKKKESSQDRASRRTANATIAIAFLTIAVVVVGALQYLIFKAQLKVMADQLIEMKGTGTQTDTLIETNKKLAEAATKSAQLAEQAMKLAQRAELGVGNWEFLNVGADQAPTIKFKVGNLGKTAAIVTEKPSIIMYASELPSVPAYPVRDTYMLISAGTSATLVMDQPSPKVIEAARYERMKAGNEFIFVYGRLTYRDIFDDVWDLGYVIRYEAIKDSAGNITFRDAVPEVPGFSYLAKRQTKTADK